MTSTLVLRVTARLMVPVVVLYAAYLLVRGHDAVGGGFIAGLVAGAALVLRFFADGGSAPRVAARPLELLGAGILLCGGYGLVGLVSGAGFLAGTVWQPAVPLLGDVKVAASLIFDIGVLLVVVAAIGGVLRFLGEAQVRS
jgi:multisubunit Na+/H+ antiporter MnhB subunit